MKEPEQGKYGLWYVEGVNHGFPSKEHAEEYLQKKMEGEVSGSDIELISTTGSGGGSDFSGYGAFQWVFLFVATLLVIFAFKSCTASDDSKSSAERKAERAEKVCIDSTWAWTMSQRYVRDSLISPSSAEFPFRPNRSEHISGCTHIVVGEFEAKNGFGVMIKQRFSAKMTYNKASDTWSGSDLHIQ